MTSDTVLLAALAERLARLGLVVVRHGTHIAVRGALLSSIRVRIDDGVLHCEPFIAYLPRTRATIARNFGLSILAAGSMLRHRGGGDVALMAFLALTSWGFDALCYVLTESAMAQTRQSFIAVIERGHSTGQLLGAPAMAPVTRAPAEVAFVGRVE